MKTKEIRRRNLLRLVDTRGEGQLSVLGELVDRNPSVLSQVKNDRRGMGERLARHIEHRLGLPENWMDQRHGDLTDKNASTQVAEGRADYVARPQRIPATSRAVLKKLGDLARDGSLSESDFMLIERLVSRFEKTRP